LTLVEIQEQELQRQMLFQKQLRQMEIQQEALAKAAEAEKEKEGPVWGGSTVSVVEPQKSAADKKKSLREIQDEELRR